MSRISGRNGRVYMALTSGGTAEPVAFLNSWSINFATEKFDVTAFGDDNRAYVPGKPDASGEFSGFYDDATVQTYTAATDGQKRKFYLYPSTDKNTQYFFGEIHPDFNANATVSGAVEVSSSWSAAGKITKQG